MLRGRMGATARPSTSARRRWRAPWSSLPTDVAATAMWLGRDIARARLAAIADALWQGTADHDLVEREIVAPVSARLTHEKARHRAEAAATKVDFFTLVRGED